MERTVPSTASEEVELYLRTFYSLLRSTAEVRVRTLEEVHAGMRSLLHPLAREAYPDIGALVYSNLRLPACMPDVQLVVLGQRAETFMQAGYGDVTKWQEVFAQARRRRSYFDGHHTLACFIASRSDIDDVIPMLVAYQIEWNKLSQRLRLIPPDRKIRAIWQESGEPGLAQALEISVEDISRLYSLWGQKMIPTLEQIQSKPCDLRFRLLNSSLSEYRRARNAWWENIKRVAPGITEKPVYFVSSNVHSAVNLLSGFAQSHRDELISFLRTSQNIDLLKEWQEIKSGSSRASEENLLYYLLRLYHQSNIGRSSLRELQTVERSLGIQRVPSRRSFDVEAQVIEMSRLDAGSFDSRLRNGSDGNWLAKSDALILNIDYPLGLAAYDILAEISTQAGNILGVYVMGKAATLNAVVGDVMISNVIHDEHSQNTYLFANCFSAADVAMHLTSGTVLDNQKAVTVRGTFLQNAQYMDVFYREGYTVIEMEAGPYLSAVYEMFRPKRHPVNEIVNLFGLPFDLGLIHYASDTPLSKGKNLGAGSLSYLGMDSTYAATLAILRRILSVERQRLQSSRAI